MLRLLRLAGRVGILLFALSLLAAVLVLITAAEMHPDLQLQFGDDALRVSDLDAGHWLLAMAGITLALGLVLTLVLTIVPLSLAFAAAATAAALACAVFVMMAVAAWLLSPLLALGALVWWLARRHRGASRPGVAA